ncbi:tenascin-X-like isoform X4 [Stegostoma tigrinum]|uniref:tenascin-X-like isoform X4 n=1 Tax=Stegostoma tigrinum TaxID=3053191 RepID=UPI00286FD2A7|nr:tenascin-X-like isoform X4 [Stegostoma tigrinum]
MGFAFKILLLLVAVTLEGGDCGIFVKTIRQRRALLPNATSGRPTTFNHVYNIRLPYCKNCSANIAKPLARIFEAQDEARDDQRFEHTIDPTNQVVFTHRINIPPQVCGCDEIQALLNRLQALEKQIATLEQQCSSSKCCGMERALDCGAHGTFSPSSCSCVCDQGWTGPTCAKVNCPVSCHPPQGDCVDGQCVCRQGFTGKDCSKELCPGDCNDQGRCIDDECVCFPGYTGYGCTEQSCPGNCSGHGRCVGGSCDCNKGYSGFDCGLEDCPRDCSGHGRCVSGKCVCRTGFSGQDCSLQACPSNCHHRGSCVNGKCVCRKGFAGPACGDQICPENCSKRGRCVNGKCVCNTGYSGPACGVQTCPENCNKRGRCVNGKCVCNTGYSGPACGDQTCPEDCNKRGRCVSGKCVCNTGYSGPACGDQTCPENCNKRGRCVSGKCVCNTGYSGPACGDQTCPENCNKRGRCVSGKCVCNTGYSGPACGDQTCPENCNKRGRCVSGKCVCNTGYSGPACGDQTCPENCNKRGRCVSGKCVCNTGYSGPTCGVQTCPEDCNKRGRCVSGKCVCNTGYSGPACGDQTCPEDCSKRGRCVSGKCVCNTGYSGPACGDQTCPEDCNKRGRCVSGKCVCNTGYSGPACGDQTCPENCNKRGRCVSGKCVCNTGYSGPACGDQTCLNNCSSQGRCVDGTCACKDGFTGDDCSIKIPAALRLHVKKVLENKVIVGWDLPKVPVDAWEITFRALKEDDGQLTNLVAGSKSTFQQTGLASGQEYEVTLRAKKNKKLGPSVSRTLTTLIDGPQNLHVVSTTNSTIELGWKKPLASIDRYRLNYLSATGKRSQVVVPASNSSVVLTGLEAGVEHTISLVGERGQHQSKAAATKGTTVIDSPRSLRVVTVTDSSIRLQWEKSVARVGHYHIVYTSKTGKRGELRVPGKNNTATLVQLEDGTKYAISLVGEQGTMKSKPVIIMATTEGGTQGKLAGGYLLPTAAASENQLIQDISRTISKKITASELSAADVHPMMRSVIRRYPAFVKSAIVSAKVLLSMPPAKVRVSLGKGQKAEGPKIQQASSGEGPGRRRSPGIEIPGSPAVSQTTKLRKGTAVSPSPQQIHKGVGISEPNKQEIPGGKEKAKIKGSPQLTSKLYPSPLVSARGTSVSTNSAPGSKEPRQTPAPHGTPSHADLSWDTTEGLFSMSLLKNRDPSANTVQSESLQGGDQWVANIAGPTIGKTHEVSHHGTSGNNPSQPIHIPQTAEQVARFRNVTVRDVTAKAFRLSWKVPEGAFDSFVIQYRAVTGSPRWEERKVQGRYRSVVIKGLEDGTDYMVRLYGVREGQRTGPTSLTVSTEAVKLGNVSSSNITANSLQLSWTVDRDRFDSFLIQYRVQGSEETQNITVTSGQRSHLIIGLKPTTRYTIYLYGISDGVRTEPLSTTVTTTAEVQPQRGEVRDVTVSNITAQSFQLSWVTEGEYESFFIEYRAGEERKVHKFTVPGDHRSTVIAGLRPTTKYTLHLSAVSAGQRTSPLTVTATTTASGKKPSDKMKPGQLTAVNVTSDSVQLSWPPQKGVDFYILQYRVRSSAAVQNVTLTGGYRSFIITGLTPATKYLFSLYSVSRGQHKKPLLLSLTTKASPGMDRPKPQKEIKLGALSVSEVTANSAVFSWTAKEGFDAFLIQYRVHSSGAVRNFTVTGGNRSAAITGLRPSTKYTLHVHGVSNGKHTKPLSRVITTKASKDKEAVKLGNVSSSNITANSLRLSWTVDRDRFDSFLIQYRVQGSEETQNITVTGGQRSHLIVGLKPTTRYTIYLYGISDGIRTEPLSTTVTTTEGETTSPVQLGNVSSSNITANSLRLSWTVDRDHFDSFLIQYRVRGSEETQNITVTGGQRSHLIVGLKPTTRYTIYLYGVFNGKRSKPLTAAVTTTASTDKEGQRAVTDRGNVSVSKVTADSLKLSWEMEKSYDSILIEYRPEGSEDDSELPVTGDHRSAVITGLTPSTTYRLYVYGLSGDQRSRPLTTSAKTAASAVKDTVKPHKLGELSVSHITNQSFRLSWTASKGFDSFLIQYSTAEPQGVYNLTVTGDQRSAFIKGLRPTTIYTVRLYGVAKGQRTKTLTSQATTAALTDKALVKPVKLGPLSVSTVTADSVRVSWTTELAFGSFLIEYRVVGSQSVQNVTVMAHRRSYLLTGLRPSTKYTVTVYGISRGQRTALSTSVITTRAFTDKEGQRAVTDLSNVSVSKVTADSLKLSWEMEKSYDSFLIEYRPEGSEDVSELPVTGDHRSAVITDLRPSTTYRLYVYGLSGDQRSRPLTTWAKTAALTDKALVKPVKLGTLSVSTVTADSVRVSWTTELAFGSFLIEYRVVGSQSVQNVTVMTHRRSYLLTGLRPSTKYTVTVYGISRGQRTALSTSVITTRASTDKEGQRAVTDLSNVSVSKVSADSLKLSWEMEKSYDSFLIQYRPEGSEDVSELPVTGDHRSAVITGLTPSTTYRLYVYGLSGDQRSRPLTTWAKTAALTDKALVKPVKLGPLSVSAVTADSARISWTTELAFGSFLIEYRVVGSQSVQNVTVMAHRRSYLLTGLRPSTKYTVTVYGISRGQHTALSTSVITTRASTDKEGQRAVTDLSNVSVSKVTADSLKLSWEMEKSYDSFLIEYRPEGSEDVSELPVTGDHRSAVITGLTPSTTYRLYVYGLSGDQRSRPLTTWAKTAALTDKALVKPVKLGPLSVSTVTADSVRVSWTTELAFGSFLIEYRVVGSQSVQNVTVMTHRRSYLLTGLRPSTKYTVTVYGISRGQHTALSTSVITTRASTDKEGQRAVTDLSNVSVSKVSADSLKLSWEMEKSYDSFLIEYRPEGSEDVSELPVTGDHRSAVITGLRPSTTYRLYVSGLSGDQRSRPLTTWAKTAALTDKALVKPVKLGTLSISAVTADSARISWTTELAFGSFLIEYRVVGSQSVQNVTVMAHRRSYLLTGLRPSTKYTITVYGISRGQRTALSTSVITTRASTDKEGQRAVTDLSNVSVSKVTADSLKLSWETEKSYDSFLIEYRPEGSEDVSELPVTGDHRSAVITGLTPSTTYRLHVYGLSGDQRSRPLTTWAKTADKALVKPVKLGTLSVSTVTADSVRVSWTTELAFGSFLIEYRVVGSQSVQNVTVMAHRRSYLLTGLRPSTKYTVTVYGISRGQRTALSTSVITTRASTDKEGQRAVTDLSNVSVSKVTADSLKLSWETEKSYDSFLIEYRPEGSEDVSELPVTGDHRSAVITGLRPSTTYRLYVSGLSGDQRSRPLTTWAKTAALTDKALVKPVKLGPLSISAVTADSARVSWTTELAFGSFLIEYRVVGSQSVQNVTVMAHRRSYLLTGLRPSTKYTVTVYGISRVQRTALSTSVVTTRASAVKDTVKPHKLGELSVSHITNQSFRLSWTASKGFDSFLIQYSTAEPQGVYNLTVTGDQRSAFIKGLRPTTIYTVRLYGVAKGQRTKPLTSQATTAGSTDEVSPTARAPVPPGVSHITAHSLQLAWTVGRVYEYFLIQYRAHGSQSWSNLTVAGDQRSFFITGLRPSTKYTIYLYGAFQSQVTKLTAFVASTTVKEGVRPTQVKALGSLSVSNITADSLELSWSTPWAFDSYVIQYRAQGSEDVRKLRVSGKRRSYVLVGLKPTTKYTIYIYGVYRGRHASPLSIVVMTTVSIDTNGVKPSRLSKLIRLSGNNVTQDSLQIFWAAESGFDSFLIQYRVEGSEEVQNFTVPAHQHSSFIEGLRPGTKYLISLSGLSGSRRTRPLTTVITTAASAEKELVKSGTFGSLSFSNITADSFLLSWSADTVFDSFLIQYKAQESELLQNVTVTGDRRSALITGLRPTTNYTIYLYGVSSGQPSRPLVALLTITAVPVHTVGVSALGRLSVSDVNTRSLKLSWAVEEGGFDSFLVQYRDSNGQLEVKEVTVPGNLRSVSITDLTPNTEYLVSLYGVLQNRRTEPIPIVARTAQESPSRLSFSDLTDSSVTVHWAALSAPVDNFKISYVPRKRGELRSVVIDGTKTSITLRDLLPDTPYEVTLVFVRGPTESPAILDRFTTAPDAPTDLKAVNVTEVMALLVWRPAIAPIDRYTITYSSKAGPSVSQDVSGNSAELQLTDLSVNTEYTADIYSVSGNRSSSRISTSFVTGSDLPKDLTVSDISSNEGLVSWKSPRAPVTGYLLLYGTGEDLTQQVRLDGTEVNHRLRQLLPSTGYTVKLHALRDSERATAVTTHFNTAGAHIPFPKDCGEELSNGRTESSIVTLYLNRDKDKPIKAYCDMETDGGGWLVFQRRMNGKTKFIKNWKAYETGFGDLAGEHWLGLKKLHQLTAQQHYELRVDLRSGQESAYATYDNFVVEGPAQRYKLRLGKYSGNAGNSLSYHHGSNFTTVDADNDEALTNCAVSYRGGWWYKNCHRVNLNGEYGNNRDHQGVNWFSWKGFEFSIPFTEMKIRPHKVVRTIRKE